MKTYSAFICVLVVTSVQAIAFYENNRDKYNSWRVHTVPSSFSSSSSSAVTFSDEEESVEQQNWSDEADACPKGMFLNEKKCRPCAQCAPDRYELRQCTAKKDAVCDSCLSPGAVKNQDYRLKCVYVMQMQKEFQHFLEQRNHAFRADVVKPLHVPAHSESRFSRLSLNASYKIEMIMEACFYLALIALIFVVIRFISKSKPYYRTVTINPPMLDESDSKNIIRAADHIREKLGKKGYERLEEFI